ncbi:hypothetical protein V6N13_033837 [Hibiscus sabdariffa]
METLLVYVKDDFFDSLSCDSLAGGSRNGRTRFSEQMTRDTETFGDSLRHRCGRGGHGPFHGGQVVLIMEEAMVMAGESIADMVDGRGSWRRHKFSEALPPSILARIAAMKGPTPWPVRVSIG